MDMMEAFHTFALEVAEKLNEAKQTPVEGFACSVLFVIAKLKPDGSVGYPMGGSLNYDDKTRQWYVTEQLAEVSTMPPSGQYDA